MVLVDREPFFSITSTYTSQEEGDEGLIYKLISDSVISSSAFSPIQSDDSGPTSAQVSVSVKLPVGQVYFTSNALV